MKKKITLLAIILMVYVASASTMDANLLKAAENGNQNEAREALKLGADPEARDRFNGETALIKAIKSDSPDLIKMLLENEVKADIETADNEGTTVLIHAILRNDNRIFKLIIDRKINLDRPDRRGVTPLMHALAEKNEEAVKMLIDKGADIFVKDCNGASALLYAVANDLLQSVTLLLSKGARKFESDRFGYDSFSLAERTGNHEILGLLKGNSHANRQYAENPLLKTGSR
ncbi:MAG: ankyrin repeat domain-containing protein [Candidatus Wallbacteria bacterium]|nr:ankyrin repeat domain-containing protein [Candidatus Wallbacteria bacterium]